MDNANAVKAVFEIPDYVYYVAGFILISHFGSVVTFFGFVLKQVVDYKIAQRDISDLRDRMGITQAELAKAKMDLDQAHNKIRNLESK